MSLTDTDVASVVVETVNKFRRDVLGETGTREDLFVAQATLISDVTARMAKDETPMNAARMIEQQLLILFEDNPGLQQQFLAEQLHRLRESKR